jgi:GT2 family glycosyltransferase
MRPVLSIVIATHNRYEDLCACVNALAGQDAVEACEVIVVDSASNEDCRKKLVSFVAQQPMAKLHRLDEPGVSRARNLGAKLATATWFATLDDDAIPKSGWVKAALELCGTVPSDVGIVQGRVDPLWPESPAPQLGKLWRDYLSIVQLDEDGDMTTRHVCAGANMLISRDVWAAIGGYNTAVGRVGSNLVSGIDTDLALRVVEAGFKIHYSNRIAVLHKIHKNRLTREWIVERALMEGKAQGMTRRRSIREKVLLTFKLVAAIPALDLLSRVRPDEDDLLVRKQIDVGMLRSLFSRNSSRAAPRGLS